MHAELEAAQKDLHEDRGHSQGLLKGAEDAREQLRAFTTESAETVRKLNEAALASLRLARQDGSNIGGYFGSKHAGKE